MVSLNVALKNSAIVSIVSTLLLLLIASLAGYGFEVFSSKIRERAYSLMLLTMMIPFAAIMIPLFTMFAKVKLIDSLVAVILPTIATPFMVFFFRQNTKSFSRELIQAARVED